MKRRALSMLALALLASCGDDDIPDYTSCPAQVGPPPPGYKILLSIDTLRNTQGQLEYVVKARDTETYPCANYTLQNTVVGGGNQLTFSICDVQAPSSCISGPGVAIFYVPVNSLLGNNIPIEVNVRGQRTTGTLRLAAVPYSITLNDTTYAAPR